MSNKSSRSRRAKSAAVVSAAATALAFSLVQPVHAAVQIPTNTANVAQQQANGDIVLPLNWDVTTNSMIKGLKQQVNITNGKFDGSVTVPAGSKQGRLKGKMVLPETTSELKIGPFPLAKTTMKMTPIGDVQGTVDLTKQPAVATNVANLDVQIVSIKPILMPFNLVGNKCHTESPVVMTMKGAVDVTKPNTFTSTYTLPKFKDCGLSTWIVNMLVPGKGNTQTSTFSPRTPHQNPVQQPKPMPANPNPGTMPSPVKPMPGNPGVKPAPVDVVKPIIKPAPVKPAPVKPAPVKPGPVEVVKPVITPVKPAPVKPMPVKPVPDKPDTKPVEMPADKPVAKPVPKPAPVKPMPAKGKEPAEDATPGMDEAKPATPGNGGQPLDAAQPTMPQPGVNPVGDPLDSPMGMPQGPGKKTPAQGKNFFKKFSWLMKFA